MKRSVLIASILLVIGISACSKAESPEVVIEEVEAVQSDEYNAELAAEYGADDWGMHRYVIAFLYKGPNRETDSLKAMELQKAHMDNIGRMAEEGKLVLAGPFIAEDSLRGLYFFDVETIEEARALTETDPAIQSGHLTMELKEWYGSAAMMGINKVHHTLAKPTE